MTSVPVHALVTGGSGAIGAAICRRLASTGHFVHIHAHQNTASALALSAEIKAAGGASQITTFDVTDEAATTAAIQEILVKGPVQILINNAGVHDDAVFPGMNSSQWHRVMNVSVTGFFNVTQPLIMPMIRTRWGRIVNLSSVAAAIGNRGQVNYSAAKGALNAATRSLALEVASRGITVNAVAPGIIESPMSSQTFSKEAISELVPMRRIGKPEEVANLVAFLISDEAAYITGQVISINGGIV